MLKVNLTIVLVFSFFNLFAQFNFEQVFQQPPAPQGNPVFDTVVKGATAFADVDGDSDQDVLISGLTRDYDGDIPIAKLYRNDGSGVFTEITEAPFDGVEESAVAFADVDGDLDQDVLIAGLNANEERITKLYINDGNAGFSEQIDTPFEGVMIAEIAFEDVDEDSDQDVLITGLNSADLPVSILYINDGEGNFSEATEASFRGVRAATIAFADINGDENMDVFISGFSGHAGNFNGPDIFLYYSDGTGAFTEVDETPYSAGPFELADIDGGPFDIADIDGDSDQDLLIFGEEYSGTPNVKLFTNDGNGVFTEVMETPFEPASGVFVEFIDIDQDSDQDVLISGNGYFLPERYTKIYSNDGDGIFTEIPDTGIEEFVNLTVVGYADVNGDSLEDLLISGIGFVHLFLNNGNRDFIRCTGTPFERVTSGSVALADVDGDTDKDILILGYFGYSSNRIAKLYRNMSNGNFEEIPDTPFDGLKGAISFADVDGDHDQDVLIVGSDTKLFYNDGNGVYTEVIDTPFDLLRGPFAFADIDNDNDLDLLGMYPDGTYDRTAKLFENNGSGIFTEIENTIFDAVQGGSVEFVDIDGDHDQDVLIIGSNNSSTNITKFYMNNGSGVFTRLSDGYAADAPFQGVRYSAYAFADVDGDLDQDVLITGRNYIGEETANLYINQGDGVFTKVTDTPFKPVQGGSIGFADVDGDSDQDVYITGEIQELYTTYVSKLYINDGMGNFTEVLETLPFEGFSQSVVFSDVDGDLDQDVFMIGSRGKDNHGISNLYLSTLDLIPPTIVSDPLVNVIENVKTSVYTATADEDVTFSLGTNKDEHLFILNTDVISFLTAPDFENALDSDGDNEYLLDITATDASGNETTTEVVIVVTDLDDTAPIFSSPLNVTVAENIEASVYTATADEDVTFSLGANKDEDLFKLSTDAISFLTAPDFENALDSDGDNEYLLDITATDASGNATTSEVAIVVTDVDEISPVFTSSSSVTVAENIEASVYTAIADEDVTFSLGTSKDEDLFKLSTDAISFLTSPDFENALDSDGDNEYLLDITATDASGNATTSEVAIVVTDVDEISPVFTSSSSVTVAENIEASVYTAIADEDVTFSLGTSKDEDLFKLSTDAISFLTSPDFENALDGDEDNEYRLDITATDASGNATTMEVAIVVTDADEIAPTLTSPSSVSVEENTEASVYTAIADEDVTFSLGTSKDEDLFKLSTDAISFLTSPDFENALDRDEDNKYRLDITATDASGNATTIEVAIVVTDVDEISPVFTSPSSVSVEENIEESVYTAIADEDVTFSLGNNKDEDLFSIKSGEISFLSAPDYEQPMDRNEDNEYLVNVIAKDEAENSALIEISIKVIDVFETVASTTSISRYNIYPNPVRTYLFINGEIDEDSKIVVSSLSGNVIGEYNYDTKTSSINVGDLKSGVYILSFESLGKTLNHRFVKK
ncbi:FG-GAP-like repeat-containing protein [Marivirga arenosa]|uniref:FG-GAP-like repeat-containing protein n=1 Tax=Marivirga arenosa TaxID=3059076 RepID=A0AA51N683_9BACT|nr:FG-GAP-like repeat-containing protein [Marivirga sp. ABR2-2]WMN06954.1 FG-GAP-like repeat-containing protein [Marivirga sp. ABR2-2]